MKLIFSNFVQIYKLVRYGGDAPLGIDDCRFPSPHILFLNRRQMLNNGYSKWHSFIAFTQKKGTDLYDLDFYLFVPTSVLYLYCKTFGDLDGNFQFE